MKIQGFQPPRYAVPGGKIIPPKLENTIIPGGYIFKFLNQMELKNR